MLPRRNSTNVVTPGPASPRPTSGPFVGGRPLSVATDQQPFHASTAEMLETESPQSEAPPQAAPPIPPRPVSFPHLPPGVSGLRRKTTRHNTYDTYPSLPEEQIPTSSQPLSIVPIPSPMVPQISGLPPPTPMRPRQPAPGGGIGGWATATPTYHDSGSRDSSHRNTGVYNYRFDTMPAPRPDSDPPHYESADVTGGIHAKIWPTYNKISKEFDDKRLEKWNSDLDVLLIFVSVSSSVIIDSHRTDITHRLPCSLPSSQPFSLGPSTT